MVKILIDSNSLKVNSKYIFSKSIINDKVKNKILEYIPKGDDNSINMEDIQKAVVPIVKNIDIFFSYSHDDEVQVKKMAQFFIEQGYKVFLDCLFWKSVDDALNEYNRRYNRNLDGTYDYKKAKLASSTFDMILSDSIIETVKNSKVFIYVKNSKNLHDDRTISPWIYLENKIANSFHEKSKLLFEDSRNNPKITFHIDTYGYYRVNGVNEINNLVKEILK